MRFESTQPLARTVEGRDMQRVHAPEPPKHGPILSYLFGLLGLRSLGWIAFAVLRWREVAREDLDECVVARLRKVLVVVMLASVFQAFCVVGMATWKRWGVVGYLSLALVDIVLLRQHRPHDLPYRQIAWIVLTLIAVIPRWRHFD